MGTIYHGNGGRPGETVGARRVTRVSGPGDLPQVSLPFPVVGVAASAGGMAALFAVPGGLPAQFPAAVVVVVQHLAPNHRSVLAELLSRKTALAVHEASKGDRLQPGHVYTAPPDRHLLVNSDLTLSLSTSATLTLPVVTRRGQQATVQVTCTPLTLAPHPEVLVLVAVQTL